MARADLLALTDDGLIQLANAGLVKRGLRELAEGVTPALSEAADGTLEARFADGVVNEFEREMIVDEFQSMDMIVTEFECRIVGEFQRNVISEFQRNDIV